MIRRRRVCTVLLGIVLGLGLVVAGGSGSGSAVATNETAARASVLPPGLSNGHWSGLISMRYVVEYARQIHLTYRLDGEIGVTVAGTHIIGRWSAAGNGTGYVDADRVTSTIDIAPGRVGGSSDRLELSGRGTVSVDIDRSRMITGAPLTLPSHAFDVVVFGCGEGVLRLLPPAMTVDGVTETTDSGMVWLFPDGSAGAGADGPSASLSALLLQAARFAYQPFDAAALDRLLLQADALARQEFPPTTTCDGRSPTNLMAAVADQLVRDGLDHAAQLTPDRLVTLVLAALHAGLIGSGSTNPNAIALENEIQDALRAERDRAHRSGDQVGELELQTVAAQFGWAI